MPARSAGILIYRRTGSRPEVLLVHPGGPFWRKKHLGAWQLPKGLVARGEDDESAARREVAEELGIELDGSLTPLGEIRQTGGKIVVAFAIEHDLNPAAVVSNMIELEWPPRSGRMIVVPEIDDARWFAIDQCDHHILPSQHPLIERLVEILETNTEQTA